MDNKTASKVIELLIDRLELDAVELLSDMVNSNIISVGAMLDAVADVTVRDALSRPSQSNDDHPTAKNDWLLDARHLSRLSEIVEEGGLVPAVKYLRNAYLATHNEPMGLKLAVDYIKCKYAETLARF